MRIRGHSAVLWREPGVSQIGTEAGHRTVLAGLSPAEQRFLDQLPEAMSKGSVYHLARRTLVPIPRTHLIIGGLEAHGALVRGPGAESSRPDAVYWDRLGADATARSRVLESACAAVYGSGALAQEIGLWLAEAGVGTILSPAGQHAGGLDEVLAARFPAVRTRTDLRARPDLVITLEPHVIEPLRARRLAQEGLAHLPVLVREVSVRVGPVLGDGGLCATCLDLWERDADPCWPALATQMRTLPAPLLERLLAHQAAVLAARAAIEVLLEQAGAERSGGAHGTGGAEGMNTTKRTGTAGSTDGADSAGTGACARPGPRAPTRPATPWLLAQEHLPWSRHSVELSGADPLGLRRRWSPHPECLCSELP